MQAGKAIYDDLIDRCAAGYFSAAQTSKVQCAEWRCLSDPPAALNPGLVPLNEGMLCVLRWGETSFLVGYAPHFSEIGANDN